jgi:prepilin-type N-terminal cleavage/methylation domain-containing protein
VRRRGESGFTLIEISIGMAVLGLGVVSALQVFGGSMQLARNAGRRSEAVMHAKALLDSSLWSPELIATESQGEIGDGFRWERVIRRAGAEDGVQGLDEDDQGFSRETEVRLAVVTVVVEWDDPSGVKYYRLGTMRVEPNFGDPED